MKKKMMVSILAAGVIGLAGCGGGDSGTSSAPGGSGSCDNASVQGTYNGTYFLAYNANARTGPIDWQATVEGDTVRFSDLGFLAPRNQQVVGTLVNCRLDTQVNGAATRLQNCGAQDAISFSLILNGNNASGEYRGQCGNVGITTTDFGGSRI